MKKKRQIREAGHGVRCNVRISVITEIMIDDSDIREMNNCCDDY
jgi:hypothetical protein